ncbi:MAG: alpha/beta hydrolase [Myxococcales bacterium]|nr:alpha/beta hydrolase [Myxococcales bacterium]
MGAMDLPRSGLVHAAWLKLRPTDYVSRPPTHAGVRYRVLADRGVPPLLDVYLPDTSPPAAGHPGIVLIHGGAFVVGSRHDLGPRYLTGELCRAGFAVFCPDYRLMFRGGRLASQLDDVAAAHRFVVDHAADYRIDPERLSLGGMSAGAALAGLHAASPHAPPIHRLLSVYGLYDFSSLTGPAPVLLRRLLLRSPDPAIWRQASPCQHTAAVQAPALFLHGTEDLMVPVEQARAIHAARQAMGLPSRLEIFDGMRHGWLQDPRMPQSKRAAQMAVEFLGE